MSGSSAIASARRRRTANNEPIQTNNMQQNQVVNNNVNNSIEKITPLELLKQHEDRINNIDNEISLKIEKMISNKTEEMNLKIMNLMNELNEKKSNNNLDNNVKEFINYEISKNISTINDTIKSILLNIEKFEELSNLNNNYVKNVEELKNEINTLKVLLIKNQTLSLETHSDMIKMKDLQSSQDKTLENINKKLHEEKNIDQSENLNASSIFEKLMLSNFNNLNMNDEDNETDSENFSNKKLIIENDIDENNLSEDLITTIKNEIKEVTNDTGDSIKIVDDLQEQEITEVVQSM